MRFLTCFFLLTLFSGFATLAQSFKSAGEFPDDIKKMATLTRNAETQATAEELATSWSSFSGEEQEQIVQVCRHMKKRNMAGKVFYQSFMQSLLALKSSGLSEETRINYLMVADTAVLEMGGSAPVANFFKGVKKFAEDRTIYAYNENSVKLEEGDFSFAFGREAELPSGVDAATDEVIGMTTEETPPEDVPETPAEEETTETTDTETTSDGWGGGWGDDGGETETEEEEDSWGDPWSTEDTETDDGGWGSPDEWDTGEDSDDGWGGFGGTEVGEGEDFGETTEEDPMRPMRSGPEPGQRPDPYRFSGVIPGIVKTKPLVGPYLKLENATLTLKDSYNEVQIEETDGAILYTSDMFVGKGGRFDWEAAGLPEGEAYATFDEYTFSLRRLSIEAQDVELSYDKKLNDEDSVVGHFKYVSRRLKSGQSPSYPRFKSYYPDYEIALDMEGVRHTGGFSLIGQKVTGSSYGMGVSTVEVSKGDSVRFVAKSKEPFVINGNSITNKRAELTIYRDKAKKDSVYHRAVQLRYDAGSGVLRARKDKNNYKYARFQDSYHNVTILADYLKWDIEEDTFNISMLQGRGIVPAQIESIDRFEERRFDKLQGIARFHPLVMTYNFAKLVGQRSFSSRNMYDYFTKKYPEVKDVPYSTLFSTLRRLDQEDYIRFYPDLHWIDMKRRGILYARAKQLKNTPLNVLKARGGKGMIDFDDIFMPSIAPGGRSITMDLKEREMEVVGVDSIVLKVSYADTMILRMKPVPNTPVTIGKNRSIRCDGKVIAKAFIYNGKEFEYDYEEHTVEMPKIDSISFRVATDSGLVTLPNNIKATAGFLYVDVPNNKSQLRSFPDYPAFKTTRQSKVTFDGKEIMDGIYKDTANFRFVVDTFRVKGVGRADPLEQKFRGEFHSGGIMNLLVDSIGIREDGSLGFNHPVPEEGVELYGGRATLYKGTVKMDNSGLRSDFDTTLAEPDTSEIHYLAARLQSNDFLFLPDSIGLEANGERSINKFVEPWDSLSPKTPFTRGRMVPGEINGVSFPEATFNNYELHWRVDRDSMNIFVRDEPFTLYQTEDRIGNGFTFRNRTDSVEEEAALVLREEGLFGIGELETDRAIIRTEKFDFEEKEFAGKEAEFLITDPTHQITEVAAKNVSFVYHLGKRYVDIQTEEGGESQFDFPKLQYETSLANAVWSIDQNTVAFRVDDKADLETQRFTSTKADEGGLNFRASGANYDLTDAKLRIQGVPVIEVLDSRVYPKPGSEVVINAIQRMLPLEGAEVRIGYLTPEGSPLGDEPGSHILTDASISIRSATEFEGSGTYNYINDLGERQTIRLNKFEPTKIAENDLSDSVRQLDIAQTKLIDKEGTRSSTQITEEDNFIVEGGKLFRGEMIVKAWKLNPDFVGETRLVLEGKNGLWTEYNTEKGNTELIADSKKRDGVIGVFYSRTGRFFAQLNKPLDGKNEPVMIVQGVIEPDMEREVIRALPKAKDNGTTKRGNFIEYIPAAVENGGGNVYFEGNLQLLEEGEEVVRIAGRGRGNVKDNSYQLDVMLALAFDKSKQTFEMMGEDLVEYLELYRAAEDIPFTIRRNDPVLLQQIAEITDDKTAENFPRKYERGDRLPGDLNNFALVLSDLSLKWSGDRNAFYSYGTIGVGGMYKNGIDASVPGYVEILSSNHPNGPALNIYLEFSPDKWYLIKYDGKDLSIQSSNTELNDMLQDSKANKDKFEFLEDPSARNAFISRFRASYGDYSLETDHPEIGEAVK